MEGYKIDEVCTKVKCMNILYTASNVKTREKQYETNNNNTSTGFKETILFVRTTIENSMTDCEYLTICKIRSSADKR